MYEVTNVIYLYLIVSVLLIGFNIVYLWHEKMNDKVGIKKKEIYRKIILDKLDKETTEQDQKYFYRQLKNVNHFIWFDLVLEDLKKEGIDIDSFILKLAPVFQKLAVYYRNKDSIQKAFFVHILSKYPNMSDNKSDRIHETVMKFSYDSSIYCRENTMIYLYTNGTVENMITALKNVNNRNLFYSQKLLTDDLLKFKDENSRKELAKQLLEMFSDFHIEMQIGIINFLRLLEGEFTEQIYLLYRSHKYDKEVELAMIRYFARHKYPPMIKEFIHIMDNKNEDNDEYRIIVTSTLACYDRKEIHDVLIEALSDANWYVRKNAATSLAKMNLNAEEIKLIENSKDRYAKEMVSYVWNELGKKITWKELKKG